MLEPAATMRAKSTSINAIKAGLDLFKLSKPDSPNALRKFLEEIFNRIRDKSAEHVNYLLAHCNVAICTQEKITDSHFWIFLGI